MNKSRDNQQQDKNFCHIWSRFTQTSPQILQLLADTFSVNRNFQRENSRFLKFEVSL